MMWMGPPKIVHLALSKVGTLLTSVSSWRNQRMVRDSDGNDDDETNDGGQIWWLCPHYKERSAARKK